MRFNLAFKGLMLPSLKLWEVQSLRAGFFFLVLAEAQEYNVEAYFLNYYLLLSLERRCEKKLLKLAYNFVDFKTFKISG